MNNTYLAHYGVLGMKWGVRNYQNKDGSLTSAGKKRYDKSGNAYKAGYKATKQYKQDIKSIKKNYKLNKKDAKQLLKEGKISKDEYKEGMRKFKDVRKKEFKNAYDNAYVTYAKNTSRARALVEGTLLTVGGTALTKMSNIHAQSSSGEAVALALLESSVGGIMLGAGIADLGNEAIANVKGLRR